MIHQDHIDEAERIAYRLATGNKSIKEILAEELQLYWARAYREGQTAVYKEYHQ